MESKNRFFDRLIAGGWTWALRHQVSTKKQDCAVSLFRRLMDENSDI